MRSIEETIHAVRDRLEHSRQTLKKVQQTLDRADKSPNVQQHK